MKAKRKEDDQNQMKAFIYSTNKTNNRQKFNMIYYLKGCKIEIEGNIIEQVMEFKYLGTTVNSYGELD